MTARREVFVPGTPPRRNTSSWTRGEVLQRIADDRWHGTQGCSGPNFHASHRASSWSPSSTTRRSAGEESPVRTPLVTQSFDSPSPHRRSGAPSMHSRTSHLSRLVHDEVFCQGGVGQLETRDAREGVGREMFCQGLLPDRTSCHGRGREVGQRTQLVDDECGAWEGSSVLSSHTPHSSSMSVVCGSSSSRCVHLPHLCPSSTARHSESGGAVHTTRRR